MDKDTLYNKVQAAIDRGNNVEIRKGRDGELQVFEIKKKYYKSILQSGKSKSNWSWITSRGTSSFLFCQEAERGKSSHKKYILFLFLLHNHNTRPA